jgi:hypothetical protein
MESALAGTLHDFTTQQIFEHLQERCAADEDGWTTSGILRWSHNLASHAYHGQIYMRRDDMDPFFKWGPNISQGDGMQQARTPMFNIQPFRRAEDTMDQPSDKENDGT